MALTLSCAGAATQQSAYIVFVLSRTNIPVGDEPPVLWGALGGTGGITTATIDIDKWTGIVNQPNPTRGTWNPATSYNAGDTVASSQYSLQTTGGVVLYPLTYKSMYTGNLNHLPENFDGWWTCMTQPPLVVNQSFQAVPFAYLLNPLPTVASVAATIWTLSLSHTLFWSVAPPGDIVQLMDVYIKLNYLVGTNITPVICRAKTATATANTSSGSILNPGINAQVQNWHTTGTSGYPQLTLSNFDTTTIINGAQPPGSYGAPYITILVAAGGTPPYAYGLIAGSLPPGVSLDPSSGVISGNPSGSGIFTFTAQVTDSAGAVASCSCAGPVACPGAISGSGTQTIILPSRLPVTTLPDPRKCKLGGGIGNE